MKTNAWAFLVSRNPSVDYKTIVAPDFIDAAKLRSLLTKVTEGDLTPPGKANIRWIEGFAAGDFSIVFRVIKAKSADIGESSGDILKDSFGRDIYLVEGLVFRETPNLLWESMESSHLDQAHAKVQVDYQNFWHTNETAISDCFPLQGGSSRQMLKLEELEPIVAPAKSRKTGKSNKNIVNPLPWEQMKPQPNLVLILITTAIVLILLSLLIRPMFGGADIVGQKKLSEGCSYVTQLQRIPANEPKEWLKALEELEKKHKPATLLISTVTPEQLSVTQGEQVKEEEDTTFKQEKDGPIQMKFHPLPQAMRQLNDKSKFATNTTLEVRIIKPIIKPTQNDKDQCLQKTQPQ